MPTPKKKNPARKERKRPDFPILVYSYRAYPYTVPQAMWDQARAMQNTWNALVRARQQCQEEIKTYDPKDKDRKKARWAQYNLDKTDILNGSGLNGDSRVEIRDRFDRAVKRAIEEKTDLHVKTRLDRVLIPHNFGSGGMPIDAFFAQTPRAQRLRLDPVDPAVYDLGDRQRKRADRTHGVFGVEGGTIEFVCHLHRPIPAGSYIKRVVWVGTYHRTRPAEKRWEWYIQLVVERPPYPNHRTDDRVVGLDLGWRVMAEGSYVRIGMMADSDGRITELRLPLTDGRLAKHADRKNWYGTYRDLLELDELIGNGVEGCKDTLRQHLSPLPVGFVKMRQSGLRRVMRELAELGPAMSPSQQAALQAIEGWSAQDDKLWRIKVGVHQRLVRRRQYLYQNLAAWLARTYRTIVWEGELGIKKMAEDKGKNPALQAADRYRHLVAPADLRGWIRHAAPKFGCELRGEQTADSTRRCSECGTLAQSSAKLWIECPNGHSWDQDANSAKNFLYTQTVPTSISGPQPGDPTWTVPPILRTMVVPCSR